MKYDYHNMLTNGKMAKEVGLDPKTLRKYAKEGLIPSHTNPANGYLYYDKVIVTRVLKLQGLDFELPVDDES